jgi:ABC-type antimicrobial peptide transport system permease subunit
MINNLFKKNRRGEILARDYIIVLVLFGAVCLLLSLVVQDFSTNYNVPNMTDSNFQKNYDTFSSSTQTIYQMQNASTSSEGMSTVSTYLYTFKSTFSIISLLFGSLGLINSVLVNFVTDFGVPSAIANIIVPAIYVIFVALLIFIIVGSVNRTRM